MEQEKSIIGVMPYLRKSKMLGLLSHSFTLVATRDESIFAKVTNDMLKQAVMDARDKAKAEGKGFFGQWGSQMGASFNYAEKYLDMSPDLIRSENTENFSIPNAGIVSVKAREKNKYDDERTSALWEITINSGAGKLKFKSGYDPRKGLKEIYGGKVQ
ncbi:MAG: hypothetical protein Q8J68_00655 [Methanolobus sp.]|uniref:hypothetical protein n=1 Tax=Methanolobus sp. TaxID=1874737 RepID=UPI002730C5F2|nr:hypothetical protein [Methanolobus sp.]MDP2215793.1 hypothetical protein [Methanolobus sp.]